MTATTSTSTSASASAPALRAAPPDRAALAGAAPEAALPRATARSWTRKFARQPSAMAGAAILLLLILAAALAPLVAPHPPDQANARQILAGPSLSHPLGTDNLGRDLLSRLIWGGRWSLGAAFAVSLAITGIGATVGIVAGYLGGWVDEIAMRIVDVLLALPSIVLALAVVGMLGPGLPQVMLAAVAVWWVDYARVIRAAALRVRSEEYVTAAVAIGTPAPRILWRHVAPNVLPTTIVLASLSIGGLLLSLAGLSFLGFGAQPPTPEWGAMLEAGRPFFQRAPQLMVYPGLAIAIGAIACNLVGDGLRDALDPKLG